MPHWWKRQPLIPNLLSQELKNYLKLNVKEKNIQIADQVIIDETAGEVLVGVNKFRQVNYVLQSRAGQVACS
ncbi:hypothetical protein ACUOA5_32225, partial [Escherichia coli]